VLPRSNRDTARKAFENVTKGTPPASHRELARAIEREAREYQDRIVALAQQARDAAAADEGSEEPTRSRPTTSTTGIDAEFEESKAA
jgi:hypothetical protein